MVVDRLVDAYRTDSNDQVRADIHSTLATLDPDEARLLRREAEALAAPSPLLRVAAARAAAERTGPPLPANIAAILADDGMTAWAYNWAPRIGADDNSRTEAVLVDDIGAGPAAARRWLARGHGATAVRLTTSIAEHWRDREDDLVPILVDALPAVEASSRPWLLGLIEWMMPRVSDPSPYCEAIVEYLFSPNQRIATAAGLALAHGDDLRVLEIPAARSPMAVAALAHHDEALPWIIAALRSDERTSDMCAALPERTVMRLVPELKPLLQARVSVHDLASLLIRVHESVTDPEVPDLLAAAATVSGGGSTDAAAAVAHALITGDNAWALRELTDKLPSDNAHWYLPLAGALGAAPPHRGHPDRPLHPQHRRSAGDAGGHRTSRTRRAPTATPPLRLVAPPRRGQPSHQQPAPRRRAHPRRRASRAVHRSAGLGITVRTSDMDTGIFWNLIDYSWGTPPASTDRDEQLTRLLMRFETAEIIEFQRLKDQLLRKLDTFDVLAAHNLLMGGSGGGDSYFYFLHWIIGQGEEAYESVLDNADALIDLPLPTPIGSYRGWQNWPEWEGLISIADDAYSRVTGTDLGEDGSPRDVTASLGDPETGGALWDIGDRAELSRRLPRLYAAAEPYLPDRL